MKTLVIAAHPDDEVLGLGGTILKSDEVYAAIATDGCSGCFPERKIIWKQ